MYVVVCKVSDHWGPRSERTMAIPQSAEIAVSTLTVYVPNREKDQLDG